MYSVEQLIRSDTFDFQDVYEVYENVVEEENEEHKVAIEKFIEDFGYGTIEEINEDDNHQFHYETFINSYYFKDYAEELAYECDLVDETVGWPLNCIDWDHAAKELKYDYCASDLTIGESIFETAMFHVRNY